ncbi:hypothetical protein V8F06_009785, partial [Rhypophila decipiens]
MSWVEIQPGHWERPAGENESMIKLIGDGGHKVGKDVWSISATARFSARISSKPLAQALQDGWKHVRFRHPSIAATIKTTEDITTVQYQVPSLEDLTSWVKDTFIIVDNNNLETVIRNLKPTRYPACYYLKTQETILLHMSHWHTDGIGAFHLLAELFRSTIEGLGRPSLQLSWGQETARLVPSVEEALNLPQTPTEAIQHAANHYLQTVSHNTGALDIPRTFFPRPAGSASTHHPFTQIANRSFTKAETAALLSTCSKLDLSIESALHASVTATAYNMITAAQDDFLSTHHTSTMRHSLRPHLSAPYNSVPGACGLYTAGYMVKVPDSNSWLDNARYFNSEYTSGGGKSLLCSRREYAGQMMSRIRAAAATPPSASSIPMRGGLDFSWIPGAEGLVDTRYGIKEKGEWIQVEEMGIGVEVLTRHVYVFAWVFDGRL